jgi:hypothetical protein
MREQFETVGIEPLKPNGYERKVREGKAGAGVGRVGLGYCKPVTGFPTKSTLIILPDLQR